MSKAADSRRRCIEPLLARNMSVPEIQHHLSEAGQLRGVTVRTIVKDIELIHAEWIRRANRDPELLRAAAVATLDLLGGACLPRALQGDEKCTWYIDRVLEIEKRRAALLGLDSATKIQKQVITEESLDDAIAKLERELGPDNAAGDRGSSPEARKAEGAPEA